MMRNGGIPGHEEQAAGPLGAAPDHRLKAAKDNRALGLRWGCIGRSKALCDSTKGSSE
jgi:hypothetical protein